MHALPLDQRYRKRRPAKSAAIVALHARPRSRTRLMAAPPLRNAGCSCPSVALLFARRLRHSCSASRVFVGVARLREGCLDFAEDGRVVDGGRRDVHIAVGNFLHGAAKDFAGAGFGEALYNDRGLE